MKSNSIRFTQRINTTIALSGKRPSQADFIAALMKRYKVSRRQAYRYVLEARKRRKPMPIPERKVVFTVKAPFSLVRALRRLSKSTGESLSALVTRGLKSILKTHG